MLYQLYAERRALPTRRMELYLAQVAHLIAKTMGGAKNTSLADFLFDPADPQSVDLDDVPAFLGFNPVNKPHTSTEGE